MKFARDLPRVFVSYARKDGEALARDLRERLAAAGIPLWRDREGMEGGRDWWLQITDALDQVEFLVLVMTEAALQSELVRREWRYARQRGVAVYPVVGDQPIDFDALPRWMRSVHFYSLAHEWTKFVNDLDTRPLLVRVPFMVEDLPADFVGRPREFERLVSHLLDREREEPIAITAALRGAGGFGKSVLARALCHDEAIQDAFDDGILWVTLGEQPGDLTAKVEDLIFVLSGKRPGFAGIEGATAALVELLADRDLLIVIDDVWDGAHAQPFLQGGRRCARLITTRMTDAVPVEAIRIEVDAMRADEAVALLGHGLPSGSEAALRALAQRLGEWPLLLKIVNATLRELILQQRKATAEALAYVNKALDRRGVTFFDKRQASSRHQAVRDTLVLSISQLDEDEKRRFHELAVFPEDADIPLDLLGAYWGSTGGLDEFDTETLCGRLYRLSLVLQFDHTARYVRLHDVIRQFLLTEVSATVGALHGKLLDAAFAQDAETSWASVATAQPYWWTQLFMHLHGAGRMEDLRTTALDLRYIAAKTAARTPLAVESDLGLAGQQFPDDVSLRVLRRNYMQSSHILAGCQTMGEVRATLYVRLQHVEALASLLPALADAADLVRVHALKALPDLPDPALIRTLRPHRESLLACAVTSDGRLVATAGSGPLIRLWDAATGAELRAFPGHAAIALAIDAQGTLIAAACADRRIRLWDLATGEACGELVGHTDMLTDCAISADRRFLVSSSADCTLRIWDLTTGAVRHSIGRTWKDDGRFAPVPSDQGHWSSVLGCAISPDGRWVASCSADQTASIWDAETGLVVRVLAGHEAEVRACCFSPDGKLLATAGGDRKVKVWDCATGEHTTLGRHMHVVTSCAFVGDGCSLVSASADGTLMLWDLPSGEPICAMTGHTDWVNDCAASADGRVLASASADGTAKLWDAWSRGREYPSNRNLAWVLACAAHPGLPEFVTASSDRSLMVWDSRSMTPSRRLVGHKDSVYGCALSPDGSRVASASADHIVAIWETSERRASFLLAGHRDWVNDCAVHPGGNLLASASSDRTLRLWDLSSRARKLAFVAHDQGATCCAFSPDGRHVMSGATDGHLVRWSLDFDEQLWEAWLTHPVLSTDAAELSLRPVAMAGHTRAVNRCAFAPNGRYLVTASDDRTLKVWDADKSMLLQTLQGHAGEVNGCDVNPDSSLVASVSQDGGLRLWRSSDGACVASLQVDGALSGCAWIDSVGSIAVVGAMGIYFFRVR
ncbi:TIR domain-containing protein [Variovorax humicola]|uniref:TIR domain-containing protein n=1 Tax=Variovorax humicola TaxID=1769758 RepID=A0ABU8W8X8_9BURK